MIFNPLQALGLGWSVIPVKINKRPHINWEIHQSTRPDKDMIALWQRQFKPAGWAVVTGEISGIIILDFDGVRGVETLKALGLSPHVRTGSGGFHLYATHPGFRVKTLSGKSKQELGRRYPGLDIRGDGGYAVFYGKNESGPYTWLREPVPDDFSSLPADLQGFLRTLASHEEPAGVEPAISSECLLRRALEQSSSGRNDAGFWLVCQLRDNGFSRADAEQVMLSYQASVGSANTKGHIEPYSREEALASVKQAYEAPSREPWNGSGDIRGTNAPAPGIGEPVVPVRMWPAAPGDAAYYGLAGDFVRVVGPHTEADPVALLTSLLVAFGSAVGRSAYFMAEADRHYMNLFVVQVGTSSKGRKGTSFGHIRRLFTQVDDEWVSDRVQSGLSSGEGLIWCVRDPIEKTEAIREKKHVTEYQSVIVDSGIEDKRLLCVEGEFASTLRVLGRDGNTLSAVIRNAWDTGNLTSLTKASPGKATGAHISIVGHITKDELLRYLDSTEAGNGFGNRFLWVCVRRSKCLPEGGNLREEDMASLADRFSEAVAFARSAGQMYRDEEARALWRRVYPELSEGKPGLLGSMTARAEAQVMRLACLYALLDSTVIMRVEHLDAALELWRYCEDSARFIFGGSLGDPVADELLKALKGAPGGLTRTDISGVFGRNKGATQIARSLGVLAERGLVQCRNEVGEQGRQVERWYAVSQMSIEPTQRYEFNEINEISPADSVPNSLNSSISYAGVDSEPQIAESQDDSEWGEV